jgi:hypothetical protein
MHIICVIYSKYKIQTSLKVSKFRICRNSEGTGRQWLMPATLASQEAEIRKIAVRSQPKHNTKTLFQETHYKRRDGRVAQGVEPKFKDQFHKKKNGEGFYVS